MFVTTSDYNHWSLQTEARYLLIKKTADLGRVESLFFRDRIGGSRLSFEFRVEFSNIYGQRENSSFHDKSKVVDLII